LEPKGPQLQPGLQPGLVPKGPQRSIGTPPTDSPQSVKFKTLQEHLDPYLLPGTKPVSHPSSISEEKYPDELRHKDSAEYLGKTSPRKVLEQRVYGSDTQHQLDQANEYNKKNGLPKLEIDTPTDLYSDLQAGSASLPNLVRGAVASINPGDYFRDDPKSIDTVRNNITNGFQPIKPGQLPAGRSSPNTLFDLEKSPFDLRVEPTSRAFVNDLNIPEATKQIIFDKGPQFQQRLPESAVSEWDKARVAEGARAAVGDLEPFNPYVRTNHLGIKVTPTSSNAEYNRFTDEALGQMMNHEVAGHGIYERYIHDLTMNTPARKMVGNTVPNWEGKVKSYQADPGELINGLTGLQRSKYLNEGQRWTNPGDFKKYMRRVMNSGDVEKSMQGISPDGKRFIRSLVPLSPEERQKVIDRAAFIMPGIVQNSDIGYNQKIGEYNNMNEHFYNGFIKRAQDYGLSAIEAERLIKAAGPVNAGDAAYAGYPKHPLTREPMASQNTLDAFKGQMPKPTPRPTPKPTPTPKRNINPYTEGDLNDRKASSGKPTQLQIETANIMRRNNG
jgi:hypothetical protein